jgi:hypothetical protein
MTSTHEAQVRDFCNNGQPLLERGNATKSWQTIFRTC